MTIIRDKRKEDKIVYDEIVQVRVENIMNTIMKSCVKNCKINTGEKVYSDRSQFVRSAIIFYLENFVKRKYPEGINSIPDIVRVEEKPVTALSYTEEINDL